MEWYARSLVVLLLCFLLSISIDLGWCDRHSPKPLCREEEREALFSLKSSIFHPSKQMSSEGSNKLSSWAGEECCKWEGVICHNTTGHVHKLNLSSEHLSGEVSSSLLELKHLRYLDLSDNGFKGYKIPELLGSMSNLRYLNLSHSGFGGVLPGQLGNLSKLHYLDFRNLYPSRRNFLYSEDLEWISGLTSLKFLDMTGVNLSRASNWLQVMNKLPSLSVLFMSDCQLRTPNPPPSVNFSSLTTLDLSINYFVSTSFDWLASLNSLVHLNLANNNIQGPISSFDWFASLNSLVYLNLANNNMQGPIPSSLRNMTTLRFLSLPHNNLTSQLPDWLFHMTTLEHLDLGSNKFRGEIPNDIGNLISITYLDLSNNTLEGDILRSLANICAFQLANLSYHKPGKSLRYLSLRSNELRGPFPDTLGDCKGLEILDLAMNRLSGQIPVSLGGLSSLRYLIIDQNLFQDIITEEHFANLTSLEELYASSNPQMTLQVSSSWTPPFQLIYLDLGSWHLGPQFPAWLQTQQSLEYLNMSHTGISSAIPAWFWGAPLLERVDLSHNQIVGNIPGLHFLYVYLSSNSFTGPLPLISSDVVNLDLSDNLFRGSLSPMLCQGSRELNSLSQLDVYGNLLSGEIPDCWMYWSELDRIELGNNNLTGHIPSSMGSLAFLGSLHLRNNHLSGNFPLPLKNCTSLHFLDLSENEFTGSIPAWLGNFGGRSINSWFGTYTLGLKVLLLRSNKFNGSIPHELCHLDSLQILDLGNNNFSGAIPRCLGNFSRMSKLSNTSDPFGSINSNFFSSVGFDIASLVLKGVEYEYRKTLGLLVGIDLSSNNLSGEIPEELIALHGLIFLNLSANHLQGTIPDQIGGLTSLESLDLSINRLSGAIPQGLATISFLSHLNLSYNYLFGKIPTGTQMQGFTPLSFLGNPKLCGPPLSDDHACPEDIKPKAPTPDRDEEEEEDGWIDMKWLYFGMAWGFVVGFWGVLGPLALNRAWRHAYFQRLDGIKYKILGQCL